MNKKEALFEIIKKKIPLTPLESDWIPSLLMEKGVFSQTEANFVSKWFMNLSSKERDILLLNQVFSSLLEFSPKYHPCSPVESEKIDEVFSTVSYKLPKKTIAWLKKSLLFAKVRLDSGVEIGVDSNKFLSTLAQSVNKLPHVVDELKKVAFKVPFVYVVPNYIYGQHGKYNFEKNILMLNTYYPSIDSIGEIIHELGHAQNKKFREMYANNYFTYFADEAEQYAKVDYINAVLSNGDFHPLKDIRNHLYEGLKKKYPTLSEMHILRATAILTKREIVAFNLMSKKELENVFSFLKLKGIVKNDPDGIKTNWYINNIEKRKDYYAHFYPFLASEDARVKDIKNHILKRYHSFSIINDYLKDFGDEKTDMVLSKDFYHEILHKSGYVDLSLSKYLHLDNLYFEPKNDKADAGLQGILICDGLSKKDILQIKKVYHSLGVKSVIDKDSLVVSDEKSVKTLYKIILSDYYNSYIENLIKKEEKGLVSYQYLIDLDGCDNKELIIDNYVQRWADKGVNLNVSNINDLYLFQINENDYIKYKDHIKRIAFSMDANKNKPVNKNGFPCPYKNKTQKKISLLSFFKRDGQKGID